jgi:DNA-binding transcriptional LysR family regulator
MTVSLYVFPSLLREFRRSYPQADVKISAASGERCAAMIRNGAADLGLLTLPVEEPDLVTVTAMEEELLLVAADSHPLAARKRIAPQDLKGAPFILFEPGSNTRRVIDQFFVREQIEPRIVMETENVEIMKALVRVGLGVAIVPYQAMAREMSGGHFFITRIHGAELVRKTGWVYARAGRVPKAVEAVIQVFERVRPRLRLSPNHDKAARKSAEAPES